MLQAATSNSLDRHPEETQDFQAEIPHQGPQGGQAGNEQNEEGSTDRAEGLRSNCYVYVNLAFFPDPGTASLGAAVYSPNITPPPPHSGTDHHNPAKA